MGGVRRRAAGRRHPAAGAPWTTTGSAPPLLRRPWRAQAYCEERLACIFLQFVRVHVGFISLDKPPIAFWIQTIFAAVLGYSGWSIHLPQALAGISLGGLALSPGAAARNFRRHRWPPCCWRSCPSPSRSTVRTAPIRG